MDGRIADAIELRFCRCIFNEQGTFQVSKRCLLIVIET